MYPVQIHVNIFTNPLTCNRCAVVMQLLCDDMLCDDIQGFFYSAEVTVKALYTSTTTKVPGRKHRETGKFQSTSGMVSAECTRFSWQGKNYDFWEDDFYASEAAHRGATLNYFLSRCPRGSYQRQQNQKRVSSLPRSAAELSFTRRWMGLGSLCLAARPFDKGAMTADETSQMKEKSMVISSPSSDGGHGFSKGFSSGVPVYVMFPLESVEMWKTNSGKWAMGASLLAIKNAGVEGVMMDVWWGIVEKYEPEVYDWSVYEELFGLVRSYGLKIQVVMSMHQCGGNVGDGTYIPLPDWVVDLGEKNPDIFYTDKSGWRNPEYISLGCDLEPVLPGRRKKLRSPVRAYADFFQSFKDRFTYLFGDVIVEIQIGMGPCGELRYPSYPQSKKQWTFPGIGEFQCYDKYMLASLKNCAEKAKESEWSKVPDDTGTYNQLPEETGFFRKGGTWSSPHGLFFLEWYSAELIAHGDRILKYARRIFDGTSVKLSAKVSGIHWLYRTASHAAELGVGYYNITEGPAAHDGYLPLAVMFSKHDTIFNFTCIEMRDSEQPRNAKSSPESLIKQVAAATAKAGISLSAENALACFDEDSYAQIVRQSTGTDSPSKPLIVAFTYLRLSEGLFSPKNWPAFVSFVKAMSAAPSASCRSLTSSSASQPLVTETASLSTNGKEQKLSASL